MKSLSKLCVKLYFAVFVLEHIWDVNVQKKELGNSKNILGPHLLCLTDRALTLVKKGTNQQWEFSVSIWIIRYYKSFVFYSY